MPSDLYTECEVLADLADARLEAARSLARLTEAEQAVKDERGYFERARRVVRRMAKRHSRLVTGRN